MLDTTDDGFLACLGCHGLRSLGSSRGPADTRGQDCPDCRGRGHLRCEDCGEPATRTAQGDEHIKLCADCGAANDAEVAGKEAA